MYARPRRPQVAGRPESLDPPGLTQSSLLFQTKLTTHCYARSSTVKGNSARLSLVSPLSNDGPPIGTLIIAILAWL
jgi:hypothetical protein